MGFNQLNNKGIDVKSGVLEEYARDFYAPYFKFITTGIPFVTVKFAQSIDGRIATATGHSRWISSPESLKFAHKLRAINDAILVGSNTLKSDDPLLTTRLVKGRNPIRIVLSKSGKIELKSKMFKDNAARNIIATSRDSRLKRVINGDIIYLKRQSDSVSLKELLKKLGKIGIMTLLIEGGAETVTSFLKQKLVDKIYICMAPIMIGNGINSIGDLGIKKISGALKLEKTEWRKSGPDMIFSGIPGWN